MEKQLKCKFLEFMCRYDKSIGEAIIAEDWLWHAGALLGKATSKMMEICPPFNQYYGKFDEEIYEMLLEGHEIN